MLKRLWRLIVGDPKDFKSKEAIHGLSLVAFMAWVGLGADGLSSSCYGPEEAFKALGEHAFLVVPLGMVMMFTILIITANYCQVVELFPSGGGGYMAASRLLGPKTGLISGMALLIDYVLTISISCSEAAEAVLSFLPQSFHHHVTATVVVVIFLMIFMNLRGVKESIKFLMPIFVLFIVTHMVALGATFFGDPGAVGGVLHEDVSEMMRRGADPGLGWFSLLGPLIAAYAIGAGTYTGIEAVSNSMQILREPRHVTAKKTMVLMGISLTVMAVGLLIGYQLEGVAASVAALPEGLIKTYNAVFLENLTHDWTILGMNISSPFVKVTLVSEAFLLFVAAQAGFVGGPRMLATMAPDGWVPRWFSRLSDRLVIYDGVWFMGLGAIFFVWLTDANVTLLVVMYSINVFLTFFLTHVAMLTHWWRRRGTEKVGMRLTITVTGTVLTGMILLMMCIKNFSRGAWVTLLITTAAIGLSVAIRAHYRRIKLMTRKLDQLLDVAPVGGKAAPAEVDPHAPTAILLVNGYNGMGIHALLNIFRLFPNYYKNFIFISVSVVDFDHLTTPEEIETFNRSCEDDLKKYVAFCNGFGLHAEIRHGIGLDSVAILEGMCKDLAKTYSRCMIFGGQLVFPKENIFTRALHRNVSHDLQKRLHAEGIGVMVLPVQLGKKRTPA
ncbi:MAG: APC family permease [Planctomycetota bacterium]